MRLLIWALGLCVGGFSATVIGANWKLFVLSMRAKPGERTPSMVPLLGGLVGAGAVLFATKMYAFAHHGQAPAWGRWWWVPVVLDPGCYLVALPIVTAVQLTRKLRR